MRLSHFWPPPFTPAVLTNPHLRRSLIALTCMAALSPASPLLAGPYADSAHGKNASRVGLGAYAPGNCSHCHELKGGGIDGPKPFTLFYDTNTGFQTDNICYQCHNTIPFRSYSYQAGGGYDDGVISLAKSLDPATGTAHNLGSIVTFISALGRGWGYNSNSNACTACHNPHAAKGDPEDSPGIMKTSRATYATPISLPSLHTAASGSWGLWGDTATETMSTYTTYQAPLRVDPLSLEPRGTGVGDPTGAARDTTDYVTFCLSCHSVSVPSTTRGSLQAIYWTTEKHGQGVALNNHFADSEPNDLLPPYNSATIGDYVLSCLDCHEPHGSANAYLLRPEVNGSVINVAGVAIQALKGDLDAGNGPGGLCNQEWIHLCGKCHTRLVAGDSLHLHKQDDPLLPCEACHYDITDPCYYKSCSLCHYHGAINATTPIF